MAERTTPLVKLDGVPVGRGRTLDFHGGTNLTVTVTQNDQEVDITIDGDNLISTRGAVMFNPAGLSDTVDMIVWRCPTASTLTNVRGYRVGGTGLTVNARRNGADEHLSGDLSVTNADEWMDGGTVQNTAYAAGDKLEVMFVTFAGGPTQAAIQVDFTSP